MYLIRIGAPGADKPVIRVDEAFSGYLSQAPGFEPGDLISTGMGVEPSVRPRPGEVVEPGVDGLGTRRQRVAGPR